MNPTLSPICGPAGLGGGGGGGGGGGDGGSMGAAGFGVPTISAGAASVGASMPLVQVWRFRLGGAVMRTIFSSTGAGLGGSGSGLGANRAATSGWSLISSSSSHSAVILSSELEGTLAAAMPSALALRENFLVLQAKLFRNVVNPNGHKFSPPPTGMCKWPSWLKAREQIMFRSAS